MYEFLNMYYYSYLGEQNMYYINFSLVILNIFIQNAIYRQVHHAPKTAQKRAVAVLYHFLGL